MGDEGEVQVCPPDMCPLLERGAEVGCPRRRTGRVGRALLP